MHLVQEHANRGRHPHSKPCVMSIEADVPGRPAVTRTERVPQFCKAPAER